MSNYGGINMKRLRSSKSRKKPKPKGWRYISIVAWCAGIQNHFCDIGWSDQMIILKELMSNPGGNITVLTSTAHMFWFTQNTKRNITCFIELKQSHCEEEIANVMRNVRTHCSQTRWQQQWIPTSAHKDQWNSWNYKPAAVLFGGEELKKELSTTPPPKKKKKKFSTSKTGDKLYLKILNEFNDLLQCMLFCMNHNCLFMQKGKKKNHNQSKFRVLLSASVVNRIQQTASASQL